jgi:hypothetical protein
MSKTRATQVPGIPKVPNSVDPVVRQYLEQLAEAVEIRLGRKGDPRDRAITLRELIDSGLAKELASSPYNPNAVNSTNIGFGGNFLDPGLGIPPQPQNLTAAGLYSSILLNWDVPRYVGHAQTLIYRHTSNDVTQATQEIGVSPGFTYLDQVGSGKNFYYWVRFQNQSGVLGPYSNSANGISAVDVAFLLGILTNSITTGELAASLTTQLGTYQTATDVNGIITAGGYQTLANVNSAINANSNGYQTSSQVNSAVSTAVVGVRGKILEWSATGEFEVNEVVRDNLDKLYVCISAVTSSTNDTLPTSFLSPTTHWKLYGNIRSIEDSSSKIVQLNLLDGTSNSAAAQEIVGINSILKDSSGNAVVSATNLSTMKTSLLNANGTARATAAQVDFLNASYTDPLGVASSVTLQEALEVSASNVDGLRSQYSVKIDSNGAVAGFGLASTTTAAGGITSEFIVNADRFAIIGTGTTVTNATGSHNASVPFIVQTSPTTATDSSGTSHPVPAGVYIKTGFIKNATIEAAQVKSLNADIINAGIVDAQHIESGTALVSRLSIDNNNIFQSGSQLILRTGDANNGVKIENLSNDATTLLALITNSNFQTVAVQSLAATSFLSSQPFYQATVNTGFGGTTTTTLPIVLTLVVPPSKIPDNGEYIVEFEVNCIASMSTNSTTSSAMAVMQVQQLTSAGALSGTYANISTNAVRSTVTFNGGITPLIPVKKVMSVTLQANKQARFQLYSYHRGMTATSGGFNGVSERYIKLMRIPTRT